MYLYLLFDKDVNASLLSWCIEKGETSLTYSIYCSKRGRSKAYFLFIIFICSASSLLSNIIRAGSPGKTLNKKNTRERTPKRTKKE